MSAIENWPYHWFGIWKERGPGYEGFPTVYDFVNHRISDTYDKQKVVTYLESGFVVFATSRINFPSIFTGKKNSGSLSFRTDGVWLWLDDIGEYIMEFGLCLPRKMLEHIEGNRFNMPSVNDSQLKDLEWPAPGKY